MGVVFDGQPMVADGVFVVESVYGDGDADSVVDDLPGAFDGQNNGLIGVAKPGSLVLVTALQSGYVGLRIEILDAEPAVPNGWEDVAEASMTHTGSPLTVRNLDGTEVVNFDLPASDYPRPVHSRDLGCWCCKSV